MMYKVKHIKSGFYYQPGKNNLSPKRGKVYQTANCCLPKEGTLRISGNKDMYNRTKDVIDWRPSGFYRLYIADIPIEEFIKENIR